MLDRSTLKALALIALPVALSACIPEGVVKQGGSPGAVTGSAGGSTSVDAKADAERCPATLGTLAIDDGREKVWWGPFTQRTNVTTIEPMIRLIVQQSNCFVITSIGNQRMENRLQAITDKQRNSGEFRAGSRQEKGQRVAADFYLEPAILFADSKTGTMIGGVASALGKGKFGALGGMADSSATSVTLSLFNIRAGVQIAASEGSATATNFGAMVGVLGGSAGGALGAYTATPAGKATVAAFVDAYNKLVIAVRNYKAQNVEGGLGTGGRLKVQGQ